MWVGERGEAQCGRWAVRAVRAVSAVRAQCVWWGGAGGAGGRAGAAMEHYSSSVSFWRSFLISKKEEDVWAVRDGSMWAVGAVGVVGAVWGVWVAGRERCGSAGWGR